MPIPDTRIQLLADKVGHLIADPQLQRHLGVQPLEIVEPGQQQIPANIRRDGQAKCTRDLISPFGQRHLTGVQCVQGLTGMGQISLTIIREPQTPRGAHEQPGTQAAFQSLDSPAGQGR
ncbi:hypothetical protein KAM380_023280 [Aeromonas caviae]|nr:hypothetical protein KAM380_023280 [Aeromonas caviae]